MEYNISQKKAIEHFQGPMLVLAGPGSGKTLVITKRTQYLIDNHNVNPNKILVITFTNAAAIEMKERFNKIMESPSYGVTFGTFHAVFFNILRNTYNYNTNNILREEQKKVFFNEIIEKFQIQANDKKELIESIISEISVVKNDLIENIKDYHAMSCSDEDFKKIYIGYKNYLNKNNLIDFDDMIVECYKLLSNREDILKKWQQKYQYILIDEFQDINRLQYKIMKMLAKPQNNLFIVGDDDQSIYSFRGARPEIMLNFENDYPNCIRVLLDINYRCDEKIVESAKNLINNNKKRFQKEIKASTTNKGEIRIEKFKNLLQENDVIVNEIIDYNKKGILFEDMAILFRTNTQPRLLIGALSSYNIPFKIKSLMPNIYEHWIAKDIISYIKIANNCMERKWFLNIINRPKRYIKRDYLDIPYVSFERLKSFCKDKEWVINRIEKLEEDIKYISTLPTYAAINYIRKSIGYDDYLKEYVEKRPINLDELLDIADEIQESSKEYDNFDRWFEYIDNFSVELKNNSKNIDFDAVTLSTMHSSKGLEYKVVFIIDVNEGIVPYKKSLLEEDSIEEERRMFYVAITRAKEYLHIYSIDERYNKKLDISRFIPEMLNIRYVSKDDLKVGAIVEHVKYGIGVIVNINSQELYIKFENESNVKLLSKKVCLTSKLLKIIKKDT